MTEKYAGFQQMSLFDDLFQNQKSAPIKQKKDKKPTKKTPSQEMIDFREKLEKSDFENFIRFCFERAGNPFPDYTVVAFYSDRFRCAEARGNHLRIEYSYNSRLGTSRTLNHTFIIDDTKWILYVDEDGDVWRMSFNLKKNYLGNSDYEVQHTLGKWRLVKAFATKAFFLNSESEYPELLRKKNEWTYKFSQEYYENHSLNYNRFCLTLLMAPELEQLYKAGFSFAAEFITTVEISPGSETINCFNRLCQPESSIKKIFKTSKVVYETLKDEQNLLTWDVYRKMFKKGSITKECLEDLYEHGVGEDILLQYHSVLQAERHGKRIFTWESLQNFVRRVDMYQAIELRECLPLLSDYLRLCNTLDIEPRIDSDSLKREQDTAARTCRLRRDELMAKKLLPACKKLTRYNYQEDIFFIRGIESYDDLIDEAKQQRNCVAGYAQSIASGRSFIYVMREVRHPDRSLITVQVSKDGTQLIQAYYACNQRIRNKAHSEFLDRWLKHNRKISLNTKEGAA